MQEGPDMNFTYNFTGDEKNEFMYYRFKSMTLLQYIGLKPSCCTFKLLLTVWRKTFYPILVNV
jgi:hypothetical protein